jgi:hypothetical protein
MDKIKIINDMLEDMQVRRSPLLINLLIKLKEYFKDNSIKLNLTDYEKTNWEKYKRLVILKSKGLAYYDDLKGRWFNEPGLDKHEKDLKGRDIEKKSGNKSLNFSKEFLERLRLENEILENFKSKNLYNEDYIDLLLKNNKRLLTGKQLKYDITEFIDELDADEYADFRALTDKLKYAVISKQQEIARKEYKERESKRNFESVDLKEYHDDKMYEEPTVKVKGKDAKIGPHKKIKEEKKIVSKDKEMSGISGFNAKMKIFKDVLTDYIEHTYGQVQKIHNVRSKLMSFLNKGGQTDDLETTSNPREFIQQFLQSQPRLKDELDTYVMPLRGGMVAKPAVIKPKAPRVQRVEYMSDDEPVVKKSRKVSKKRDDTDETEEELIDRLCEKRVLKKTKKLMDKILSLEEDLRQSQDSKSSERVIDRLSSVSTEVDDLVNTMESRQRRALQQIQNFARKSLAERQVRRMRQEREQNERYAGILQSAMALKQSVVSKKLKEEKLLDLLKKVQAALKRDILKKAVRKREDIETSPIQFEVDSQGYRKRLKKSRKKSKPKKERDDDDEY